MSLFIYFLLMVLLSKKEQVNKMDKFDYELSAQIILSEDQQSTATHEGVSVNILNPFLQLTVPFLKTTQNFFVTILIFGTDDKKRTFSLEIKDETSKKEEIISKVEGELPNLSADDISSVNLNVGLRNVILKHEGKHMAYFYVDGTKITETPFYVVINEAG